MDYKTKKKIIHTAILCALVWLGLFLHHKSILHFYDKIITAHPVLFAVVFVTLSFSALTTYLITIRKLQTLGLNTPKIVFGISPFDATFEALCREAGNKEIKNLLRFYQILLTLIAVLFLPLFYVHLF